jgi:hypothetical protein
MRVKEEAVEPYDDAHVYWSRVISGGLHITDTSRHNMHPGVQE